MAIAAAAHGPGATRIGQSARRPALALRRGCGRSITVSLMKVVGDPKFHTVPSSIPFTRLGGGPLMRAAVGVFHDRMVWDDRVSHLFEGTDMRKHIAHQELFMSYAVGAALESAIDEVEAEIERLVFERGMHMGHFDVTLGHVIGSLRDINVPEEDIAEAAAVLERLRPRFQVALDKADAAANWHLIMCITQAPVTGTNYQYPPVASPSFPEGLR